MWMYLLYVIRYCGEPAISQDSHHVSLVQWTNLFASRHKGHRFKSPGGTYVKPGFSCLRCLATLVTPTWLIINRASSPTVTRPSCRQCDSPTWCHTAFLFRFHARCRSPFWLHNRQCRLLGGSPVESLQSRMILAMSHWSSGLTCLLPATRVTGSNPLGGLMWNRDSPVCDVSLLYHSRVHQCCICTTCVYTENNMTCN